MEEVGLAKTAIQVMVVMQVATTLSAFLIMYNTSNTKKSVQMREATGKQFLRNQSTGSPSPSLMKEITGEQFLLYSVLLESTTADISLYLFSSFRECLAYFKISVGVRSSSCNFVSLST